MWTISTFSGLKANGPDSNWRIGMFELCRAVNEREFGSKTEFFKGDGTEGSDLTYADFLGLKMGPASANLQRIQFAITSLCLQFTETSGGDDFWTVSSLEAAIGSELTLAPTSATDSRFWQAQKDALDRLLYTQAEGDASFVSGISDSSRTYFEDPGWFPNTVSDAWGDLGYHSGPAGIPATHWGLEHVGPPTIYRAGAIDSCLASFDLAPVIPSVVVKIKYSLTERNNTSDASLSISPIEPAYHIGTASGIILYVGISGTTRSVVLETTSNDFSSANEATISMDGGRPGSCPIPDVYGSHVTSATVDSAKVYYDLTSILSDQ